MDKNNSSSNSLPLSSARRNSHHFKQEESSGSNDEVNPTTIATSTIDNERHDSSSTGHQPKLGQILSYMGPNKLADFIRDIQCDQEWYELIDLFFGSDDETRITRQQKEELIHGSNLMHKICLSSSMLVPLI